MNESAVRKHWDAQAQKHGQSHLVSWGDTWMLDLEIQTIGSFIKKGDRVLEQLGQSAYNCYISKKKMEAFITSEGYTYELCVIN